MKIRKVAKILGDVFDARLGLLLEIPFGSVRAVLSKTHRWSRIGVEFLATGIEFTWIGYDSSNMFGVDLKILGSMIRLNNQEGFSFMSLIDYIKTVIDMDEKLG